jgi:uncharacterized protein involved in exopolysaccharide biosynthesis
MDTQTTNQKPYYGEELEISLGDYLHIIWRRRKAVSSIFIVIIILATLGIFLWPKTYQSSALIAPAKIANAIIEDPAITASLVTQDAVLQQLAGGIGLSEDDFHQLNEKFTVTAVNNLLQIKAVSQSPQEAKQLVDTISNFIVYHENVVAKKYKMDLLAEEDALKTELEGNTTRLADFEQKIATLSRVATSSGQGYLAASYVAARQAALLRRDELQRSIYAKQRELNFGTQESQIISPSVLPINAIGPHKTLDIVAAIILALFVSLCYPFVAEYVDKIKHRMLVQ